MSFGRPPGAGGPRGGDVPRFGPPGFMQPSKPIKGFAKARAESVKEQLNGAKGETLEPAFGPGGPRGFGPGNFIAPALQVQFDKDKNGSISRDEFVKGFNNWFENWDKQKSGSMSEEELRAGLNETFRPPPFGGPGLGGPGGPVVIPLGGRPPENP